MLTDEQRAQVWAEAMRRGPAWPCGKGVLRSAVNAIDEALEAGVPDPCAALQAAHDAAEEAGLSGVLLGADDLADLRERVAIARNPPPAPDPAPEPDPEA